MKRLTLFVSIVAIVIAGISCNNRGSKAEAVPVVSASDVNIYYFHFTRRCATCLAVEENARKAVEALFPNEVATGSYSFHSLNLEEAGTKEIADKLGVGGQSMLVVCGDRKTDITGAAWLVAHDAEKMKTEIKSGIDKVLFQ